MVSWRWFHKCRGTTWLTHVVRMCFVDAGQCTYSTVLMPRDITTALWRICQKVSFLTKDALEWDIQERTRTKIWSTLIAKQLQVNSREISKGRLHCVREMMYATVVPLRVKSCQNSVSSETWYVLDPCKYIQTPIVCCRYNIYITTQVTGAVQNEITKA